MRRISGSEFGKRRSTDLLNRLNGFLVLLICLCVLGLIGLAFIPEWQKRREMERRLEAQTAELQAELLLQRQREREVRLLQEDPEYIETIARDRLDLMKEGETVYRLDTRTRQIEIQQPQQTELP